MLRGLEEIKKIPKFREKFGSGWVGPRPTRIKKNFWKIENRVHH